MQTTKSALTKRALINAVINAIKKLIARTAISLLLYHAVVLKVWVRCVWMFSTLLVTASRVFPSNYSQWVYFVLSMSNETLSHVHRQTSVNCYRTAPSCPEIPEILTLSWNCPQIRICPEILVIRRMSRYGPLLYCSYGIAFILHLVTS